MRNTSTFISKVRAAFMAATFAFVGVCASAPVQANASTASSDASYRALQLAEEDFGGYLDRANDSVSLSGAKTAETAFVASIQLGNSEVSSADNEWKFSVKVNDYYMDFMSGEVKTGGYASGAAIDVFVDDTPLFTAYRDDNIINFGFGNTIDLDDYTSTTTPFILTGQVSWGVETICSADLAMAYAVYDFIVAEDAASQSTITEPVEPETIDGLYDFITTGNLANDFENLRNEANNGITNGWKSFSDVKSMIPNSNGVAVWQSGLWKIAVSGQKLTNAGLEQGFVTATYEPTGNLLRFSFDENGKIVVSKKKGGMYGETYTTCEIKTPDRYGVIDFADGDKIDSELIALTAVVDKYCSEAPRG